MTAILVRVRIIYGSFVRSARAMRSGQLAVTVLLGGGPQLPSGITMTNDVAVQLLHFCRSCVLQHFQQKSW